MSVEHQHGPCDLPVDPLLGQPRMVADPRISITQASVVLGKSPAQVHRFIALGRLPRHGQPNNGRPLLLSEVVALRDKGEPIKLVPAARRLQCSLDDVRKLIADGKLPLVPGTKSLVYPADVKELAATSATNLPRKPQVPDGYVGTAAVAKRLGRSESYIRQMAADGRLPAMFVSGRWYFDPNRIDMIERARHAQAVRGVPIMRFD
ncbi:helix-turn-helix domain-containing protein [Kribbella sp. NPDC049174]|uniref:helix-turn-helix domain-containing protein n=1 Tax=Kribbella sp. NPDC049174 TaxID=3364112 RepID=UPI00372063EB